ncbi:MAG: hypothetical protein KTR28_05225 [Micavibrio sp.]|nr:hypothetical protein [Micavibrio sp.]
MSDLKKSFTTVAIYHESDEEGISHSYDVMNPEDGSWRSMSIAFNPIDPPTGFKDGEKVVIKFSDVNENGEQSYQAAHLH